MRPVQRRDRGRISVVFIAAALAVALAAPVAEAKSANSGFWTSEPAMLTPFGAASVKPLISVGDALPGGYFYESIPDGIAIDPTGADTFDIYVNHETSAVPFRGAADFTNSMVSKLTVKRGNGKVLDGSVVIPSSANYLRFCSNFLAGPAEGFDRPLLLVNEETSDLVNRTGDAWPPGPDAEQAGVVVAYDPALDAYRTIHGLGRMNHENSVAIPGYGKAVIVTGDDTFSAPSSQFYMYVADDADAVWNDEGHLWAFVSDDALVNDYGDLAMGDAVSGSFIPVPDDVADGDQTGLESWSNANNVFQFIRVEDMAYDKNTPNVVYIADTGEPRAVPSADPAGRLSRGPSSTQGPFPNGRIFKMVLDPTDPTVVESLSILIDGDALGAASAGVLDLIHNPDNVETTPWSLMIQEDPGSQNGYPAGDPNGTAARIWRYDLASGDLSVVAAVNQLDPAADLGAWESSGIVDASAAFGRGAFLVNVQAHTILVGDAEVIPDPTNPEASITLKREGGQLLLLRVPGA